MTKRILFVDDEPRILEGLERLLFSCADGWDMSFAPGGQAAIDVLEQQSFDVLVTDMRVPGIDGPALLRYAQARHPNLVRIVLSGHTEFEVALRTMPIAHQFLCKPCDAKTLMDVLERAVNLQRLVTDEVVRGLVGSIVDLPARPRVYSELTMALSDDNVPVDRVVGIIEQDVGISSKVLHLVNSAFFSPKRPIMNVRAAVVRLGMNTLRHLVLSIEVFHGSNKVTSDFSMDAESRHALHVGAVARKLLERGAADDAFLAGMLHDVGTLLLATKLPEYFASVQSEARASGRSATEVELELRGVTHAEIGAYLLGLWGMPYPIVEAVANHHSVDRNRGRGWSIATAVQVANLLVREASDHDDAAASALDDGMLSALGVDLDLERWRTFAAGISTE